MQMKASFSIILALCASQVLALDFSTSEWIWTNEVDSIGDAPPGSRAFRRNFTSPVGKSALSANIIIVADNEYTLYVNGAEVGAGSDWQIAGSYCVPLSTCSNAFAVNATNIITPAVTSANPAGLLAAVQITYTDGSTGTIVSDANWLYSISLPVGFEQPGFDDSTWPAAIVEANFGAAPWGTAISIPQSPWTPLSLSDANWIWTNEVSQGSAPAGSRAFLKVFTLPSGQSATSTTIFISADNEYTLYVQGQLVGSGTDWQSAQAYVVDLIPPTSEIVVAVLATNTAIGPAGLIAAVQVTLEDCSVCGCVTSFVTDETWQYSITVPAGFQTPGFSGEAWPNAISEGAYGISPWGDIPVSAAASS